MSKIFTSNFVSEGSSGEFSEQSTDGVINAVFELADTVSAPRASRRTALERLEKDKLALNSGGTRFSNFSLYCNGFNAAFQRDSQQFFNYQHSELMNSQSSVGIVTNSDGDIISGVRAVITEKGILRFGPCFTTPAGRGQRLVPQLIRGLTQRLTEQTSPLIASNRSAELFVRVIEGFPNGPAIGSYTKVGFKPADKALCVKKANDDLDKHLIEPNVPGYFFSLKMTATIEAILATCTEDLKRSKTLRS